jgi:glycerate kinase
MAALGGELLSGADVVLERIDFRGLARGADLVVTGEGTVDRSTVEGKAVGEVVRLCREEKVRCEVFGGRVEEAPLGVEAHALSGDPARAADDLVELGERLARALLGFA